MRRRQRPPNYRRKPNFQLILILAALAAVLYYTGLGGTLYAKILNWRNGTPAPVEQAEKQQPIIQKEAPFYATISAKTTFYSLAQNGTSIGTIPAKAFVQIVQWPESGQGAVRIQHNGISGWVNTTSLSQLYTANQSPW